LVEAWFPQKLQFLFEPHRYKVVRGGRGSGKSWGFARALLIMAAQKPLRVLCTREIQKSIQQSVHQLLRDQIEALGLGSQYEVLQAEIRGKNGSQFFFSGLSDQTAESLKSFEGVDVCWCEEAQAISRRSWDILIPTIRKNGSEIWVSFNPQLESDETYRRFVSSPPPDCVSIEMNHADNGRFPAVLEAERQHAEATMRREDYAHIWEGQCKPAVDGAIYFDQMANAAGRIGNVPHDPLLKTHAVWDLGFNDSMSIILTQKVSSEIRLVNYIEGTQRTLADYSAELKALRLDGEQGIKRVRDIFSRVYFHRDRTARLVECLKRYRRQINATTNEPGNPVHDEFSHGADAMRYLALNADQMTNDTWGGTINYPRINVA
jgi:phage terminase large subunit